MTLQQLAYCLNQAELMEKEALGLGLSAGDGIRLSKLLRTAKEALADAEKIIQADAYSEKENSAKLRLWERKLLDLSLRNNLLNMRMGKNAIPFETTDIATLEDELDMGKEFVLEQKELKGIYRAVRTNMEESGVNTLFLTLGTLHWNERKGGREYAAPILLVPVDIVPVKKQGYAIHKRDEDVMLNVTLMEFIKQQYDIEVDDVNPLPQDAHGIDVSLVLHLVRQAVKDLTEWEVREDSVLGIFSFAKFVMWNDIHSHSTSVIQNPIVRSLVEGRLVLNDEAEPADARWTARCIRKRWQFPWMPTPRSWKLLLSRSVVVHLYYMGLQAQGRARPLRISLPTLYIMASACSSLRRRKRLWMLSSRALQRLACHRSAWSCIPTKWTSSIFYTRCRLP